MRTTSRRSHLSINRKQFADLSTFKLCFCWADASEWIISSCAAWSWAIACPAIILSDDAIAEDTIFLRVLMKAISNPVERDNKWGVKSNDSYLIILYVGIGNSDSLK